MTNKRNTIENIIIAILLISISIVATLSIYAWAKYTSSTPGETIAQVAKWHFDLTNTEGTSLSETEAIDLAETLNFEHVASDRIAPGTSGRFQLVVDTTGTEVSLMYQVEVALTNCPTNLNFYTDAAHTDLISKADNKLVFQEYLTKEQAKNYNNTIDVYWNWPYETGSTNNEIQTNDVIDNGNQGKTTTMNITATGVEVMSVPVFGGTLKNGDTDLKYGDTIYLNVGETKTLNLTGTEEAIYTSANSSIATVDGITGEIEGITSGNTFITITGKDTGAIVKINVVVTKQIIKAEDVLKVSSDNSPYVEYIDKNNNPILCKVLYNDSTHGVQIITVNPVRSVTLGMSDPIYKDNDDATDITIAQNSYNHAVENLNNYSEDYLNTELASDARCVGSDPIAVNGVFTQKDGQLIGYFSSNEFDYMANYNGKYKDEDTKYTEDETQLMNIWAAGFSDKTYGSYYWLASTTIESWYRRTQFRIRKFSYNNSLSNDPLWNAESDGSAWPNVNDLNYGLRPVFLLKSNVEITGGSGTEQDPYTIAAY